MFICASAKMCHQRLSVVLHIGLDATLGNRKIHLQLLCDQMICHILCVQSLLDTANVCVTILRCLCLRGSLGSESKYRSVGFQH